MTSVASQIFCTRCGTKNPSDSLFCCKCGGHIVKPEDVAHESVLVEPVHSAPVIQVHQQLPPPPLPPQQTSEPPSPPPPPPPPSNNAITLFNPLAAAAWSFVLTPAFSAFLHAWNWRALGRNVRAQRNETWATSLILWLVLFGYWSKRPDMLDILQLGWFVTPVVWYFMEGKEQIEYVKAQYGTTYSRGKWAVPLIVAIPLVLVYKAFVTYMVEHH